MKAVIQRVYDAKLSAEGKTVSQIGRGLAVYFCAEKGDGENLPISLQSCEYSRTAAAK